MRLTDRSGQITPIALIVPDRSESLRPNPPEEPFLHVNLHASLRGYEQITAENLQVFADTVTDQDLAMIPLSELPQEWDKSEYFNTPDQNL